MKSHLRHVVVMTIAIAGMVIGSAAIWFAGVEHGRLLELESRQVPAVATVSLADAHLFRGFDVFVCGQLGDRYSLGKFVEERGGQLQSQLNVETDYVLMPADSDTNQFANVVAEAKELHIPVGDQSKLLRLTQLQ